MNFKKQFKRISISVLGSNQCFGEEEIRENINKRRNQAQCISQNAVVYIISKEKLKDALKFQNKSMQSVSFSDYYKKIWQ